MLKKTLLKKISPFFRSQRKYFDLHEYQSKQLFRENLLKVQNGSLAVTPDEAYFVSQKLSGELILKAQVHAGGRGKGRLTSGLQGGVKICQTPEEIKELSSKMLGYNLITAQTPKEGLTVKSVLVLESVNIIKQYYLAIVLDRKHQSPVLIISKEGGMDIEEVSEKNPSAIKYYPININTGITNEISEQVLVDLELNKLKEEKQINVKSELCKLYQAFIKLDATQIEINPWALDDNDDV